jgi:hypothetical protein
MLLQRGNTKRHLPAYYYIQYGHPAAAPRRYNYAHEGDKLRRETRLWEHTDYIAHGLYLPGGGVGAGGRDLIPLRYNTAADGSCAFNFALGRVDGGAGVGLVRFLLGMCSWKKGIPIGRCLLS